MNPLAGQFTLGVEEEYQIVDARTGELRSYVSRMLEGGKSVLRERVRAEMHQSMVEVGTGVCADVRAVRAELCEMRSELSRLARAGGMRIVAAGTHPFSDWKTQEITDHARYHGIVEELQDLGRANLIFGLHVHVGIHDKEVAVVLADQVRYFLPHLLALSTSSPFWLGRPTGLASSRCQIFKRFPRTGIPDSFGSWAEYQRFVDLLVRTGCIDDAKKIWWDVRVHHVYDTIEIRICDMPTRMDHTVAIVALAQALVAKLYLLYTHNQSWRSYGRGLIEENKWRAARWGTRGKLIDFGQQKERPFHELLVELVEVVRETAVALGSERELDGVFAILDEGTSAERQMRAFVENGGDVRAVVDWLATETLAGL